MFSICFSIFKHLDIPIFRLYLVLVYIFLFLFIIAVNAV